jgi:SNF2 family DNA or RNA helicase
MVQPFILRRTKEEVLDELPEKIVREQMVELSPEEMQVYEAMRKYVEDRLHTGGSKKRKKAEDEAVPVEFFAELTKLRLAALSLSLVHDDWKLGSSKTDALMDLLDGIAVVEGNQVVVFSQFTSYLAEVRALLDRKGFRYLYLDGQTELDERRDIVRQFQDGDCPLLLSSLKAGGLGLNLTAANFVILLDPWWNPAIEDQAMDRAHRIGQKRTVNVIRLVARHTVEEKILRLHESKRALSEGMLDGTAYSGRLTMDDVLDMVSPFR